MKRRKHHSLHNELNYSSMDRDEFERLRSEYLGDDTPNSNRSKLPSFIRLAGLLLLAVAAMFLLQQWLFPMGTGLSKLVPAMLRAASFLGTSILVLIGLSLLVRHKSARGKSTSWPEEPLQASTASPADANKSRDTTEQNSFPPNHIRWYRSVTDKKLFGVCGGLAAYYQVDPTIVRILFVIAFFNYGFSLAIYVILAAVLPKKTVLPLT